MSFGLHPMLLRGAVTVLLFCAGSLPAAERPALQDRVQQAIGQGRGWLQRNQHATLGSWGNPDQPALTAMAVLAVRGNLGTQADPAVAKGIQNAYAFIRAQAKPDGGIYGKGLAAYNTAVCLRTLLLDDSPQSAALIAGAQMFLRTHGSGLDAGSKDGLTNNAEAADQWLQFSSPLASLRELQAAEEKLPASGQPSSELNWAAAIGFVESSKKSPASSDVAEPSRRVPAQPRSAAVIAVRHPATDAASNRKVALRHSARMSYDGLLSLVYDKLEDDDVRIDAFLAWLSENYTAEENPGLGAKGLFYYYHSVAKVLSLRKIDRFKLKDGTEIDWRAEVSAKLLALQQPDGSWANANGHWWEGDPVLACSYALLTLEQIAAGL
jgi:squalene-hopene/tetraprenyl-beta-curcumene cyclase